MRVANPVLKREVVERWRSRRAPMTLTIYLALLGGIMYLLYRAGTAVLRAQFGFGFDPSTAGPALGRFLVEGLFFFVLLLVLFVGPGYAAAQISGERERKTLTLLQVTLLRPFEIVLGKLGAAVAWLTLLVVAAVPLGAVAFFLGGIGISDLLRGFLMLAVLAVSVAAIGLGISSLTRRTTGSIVLTYGAVLALVLGTLFLAGVEAVFRATRNQEVRTPIALYLNPFFGLADAINAARPSSFGMGALPSPLGLMAEALPGAPLVGGPDNEIFVEQGMGVGGFAGETAAVEVGAPAVVEEAAEVPENVDLPVVDKAAVARDAPLVVQPDPGPVGPPDAPVEPGRRPVWLIVMGLYLLLGALGILTATRRLRVLEPRGRAATVAFPPPGAAAPPGIAGPPVHTPTAP